MKRYLLTLWLCLLASMANAAGSIDFNGTTSKAEHTTADVLNSASTISVSVWAYARGQGENNLGRIVLMDEAAGNATWLLGHAAANNTLTVSKSPGAAGTAGAWTFTAADNQWNRIEINHDWSTDAAPNVWVNGSAASLTETSAPSGIQDAPATGYCIGNQTAATRTWDGKIAHVQVFNTVKSQADLQLASFAPGSITSGLRMYIPATFDTDLTDPINGFNATGTALSTGADGPPIGGFPYPQTIIAQ